MNDLIASGLGFIQHITSRPLAGLLLTLLVFQVALSLYQRMGKPAWLHPVATGSVVIALLLQLTDWDYSHYVAGNNILYLLLGPATVALAVPLYNEFHVLRKHALAVLITVLIGGVLAPAIAVAIAWGMQAPDEILLALTIKSITTPIAIGVSQQIGALASLTTGIVIFTGVIGVVISPMVFYLTGLRDSRLQGVVFGLNAHAIGTARSFELDPNSGALATMAMGLTGLFTALTFPYLIPLLH